MDLAKGSRQSTLVDPGDAAHISHMHEISHICSRNLLETIDNLSIPFSSLFCCGRTPIAHAHGGNPLR
jgi:hypothetical protein